MRHNQHYVHMMTHCKVASVRLSDISYLCHFPPKIFSCFNISYSGAKCIRNSLFIQPHSFNTSSLSHYLAVSTLSYLCRKLIKHFFEWTHHRISCSWELHVTRRNKIDLCSILFLVRYSNIPQFHDLVKQDVVCSICIYVTVYRKIGHNAAPTKKFFFALTHSSASRY